jgi:hypothetical protein
VTAFTSNTRYEYSIAASELWTYPSERYRAVSGEHEYRIFNDPEERHGERLAWILGVREVREGGVPKHVHYGAYRIADWAKRAAELWEGSAG